MSTCRLAELETGATQKTHLAVSILLAAHLLAMLVAGQRLIHTLDQQQTLAVELAELEDVRYGLLNANLWVEHVTVILQKKVREFDLSEENRANIRANLSRMLDTLITEVDKYMRKQNNAGQSWWDRVRGRLKQSVQDVFIDIDDIKTAVPEYADRILTELEKPEAREDLNVMLGKMLKDLSGSSFAPLNLSLVEAIQDKHECQEWMFCRSLMQARLSEHQKLSSTLAWIMLALSLSLMLIIRLESARPQHSRFLALALAATMLMACGVLTPMMQVEARITELRFMLFQEPVIFTDQVLYFQSKSVIDMVHVLTSTGAWDMIGVGILIMMFSVLFPIAKLGCSVLWLYAQQGLRTHWLVRFFALKSGKWSMADVFVVAIFMAYIGFDGIISSQLSGFANANDSVDVLTTNGTTLELGFFMFLSFCLVSLLSASWMESAISHVPEDEPK